MTLDELIDAWEAAWSDRRAEDFAPLCAVDVHYEDPLCPEPLQGVDALADHAEALWAAFPDAQVERTGSRLSDGRYVAAPCLLRATNTGPLGSLPATGRTLAVGAVSFCEVEDGRLCRVRAFYDVYGAAVQLGILPAHGTLGERALLTLRGFGLRVGRDGD